MATDDTHHCSECGATCHSENQMHHWDWHRAQRALIRDLAASVRALEVEVRELVRARNAEIDARREAAERE